MMANCGGKQPDRHIVKTYWRTLHKHSFRSSWGVNYSKYLVISLFRCAKEHRSSSWDLSFIIIVYFCGNCFASRHIVLRDLYCNRKGGVFTFWNA
jgi:hypothetical protein